uniref:hypothetical protein n=1 Tax=Alloprevotella sp. TaxID=1872471 RepID=UPI003FEFD1A2
MDGAINYPDHDEKRHESAPDDPWRVLYEKLHELSPAELTAYIDALNARIEQLQVEREFAQHVARGDPYNPPIGYNKDGKERSREWTN